MSLGPVETIEHRGCRLAYRVTGGGPTVLFIQGVGAIGDASLPQVVALSATHRCVPFDNRGIRRAGRPAGRSRSSRWPMTRAPSSTRSAGRGVVVQQSRIRPVRPAVIVRRVDRLRRGVRRVPGPRDQPAGALVVTPRRVIDRRPRDAPRKHLQPNAACDPDRFCDEAGVDPAARVGELTDPPVMTPPGGEVGDTFDRDAGGCPEWLKATWDAPGESAGGSDTTAPTDDSW